MYLQKQVEKRAFSELLWSVSYRVQPKFIFAENVIQIVSNGANFHRPRYVVAVYYMNQLPGNCYLYSKRIE